MSKINRAQLDAASKVVIKYKGVAVAPFDRPLEAVLGELEAATGVAWVGNYVGDIVEVMPMKTIKAVRIVLYPDDVEENN